MQLAQVLARSALRTFGAYAIAAVCFAASLAVTLLLRKWSGGNEPFYPVFTAGVLIAAWFGGFGPGLVAGGLSVVTNAVIVFGATGSALVLPHAAEIVRLIAFGFVMAGVAVVGYVRRRALDTEGALRRERGILKSVMQGTDVMLVYLDTDFNFVAVNTAYAETCHATPEQLVGKNHFDLYPHDENEAIFRRVRDTGIPVFYKDKPFRFPDQPERGTTYWDWSLMPLKDESHAVTGLVFSLRETTKFKRAEEALRVSEERYRTLFENMTDGFALGEVIFDEHDAPCNFRLIATNNAFEQQTGLSPDIVGLPITEALPRIEHEWIDTYCRVAMTGRSCRFENYNVDTGRHYDVFAYSPAPNQFAILFRDVTEKKRADEERARLYKAEQEARANAEQASRLKDEFLATLSHELRTPLNAILGWAHLLKSHGPGFTQASHAIDVIARNAEVQARLVEDVLDVSRIITGKLRLTQETVDLASMVERAMDVVRPAAEAKEVSLSLSLELRPLVVGDPDRLQQVMWNLLSNAVKFNNRRGRVDVTLRGRDGYAEVQVSDTGIGIAEEFIPRVFERFSQHDSSLARGYGGLGLGLAIVRHIVEMHGGTVSATSAGSGAGSTFTVALPIRAVVPDGIRARERSALAHFGPGALSLSGVRILVVDDDASARELLQTVLLDFGASVIVAASSREGIELLRAEQPHLVISDIGMPEEDGYTFLRKVRSLPREEGGATPAIALTAYGQATDRFAALEAGYDQHVAKPVLPQELAIVVAALLRKSMGV